MTEREFETYLELLGQMLRLNPKQRGEISAELRDHLEARMDELLAEGLSRPEAIQIAIQEFGNASGLAEDFVSVSRQQRRRWAMRFATFSIVGCFLSALLIFSLWPDQDRLPLAPRSTAQESSVSLTPGQGDSVEERTALTRHRLESSILNFEYEEMPFGDFLNRLRDQHELEFYLDDSSELKGETPITMNLRNVRLSMALELLLRQYNSQFIVRDGLVLIASVDEMAELGPEIRVYNCRDLVGVDGQTSVYGAGPISTPDEDPAADVEPKKAPSKSERLTSLIKSVVSPVTWEEEGPSIVVFDGLLVVNCTPMVHQQIEQLLSELRKVSNASAQPSINDSPK